MRASKGEFGVGVVEAKGGKGKDLAILTQHLYPCLAFRYHELRITIIIITIIIITIIIILIVIH